MLTFLKDRCIIREMHKPTYAFENLSKCGFLKKLQVKKFKESSHLDLDKFGNIL